jgi:hypothetical protein
VFSHANQVKNMLAQFGTAVGISVATLTMQWRSTVRYTQLAESVSAGRAEVEHALAVLTAHFSSVGDPAQAHARALVQLGQLMTNQSLFMAVTDYFGGLAVAALVLLAAVVAERMTRG